MARQEEHEGHTVYAVVRWNKEDVQELRPDWSLDQCERWLADNAKYIGDAMVEAGWDAIKALLP